MDKVEEFNGIKLLSGINTHPGSGNARQHQEEYDKFQHVLLNVAMKNKNNPVMIELGSNWALWSLCFRKAFPNGKNILIELGKRALLVGVKNFDLNNFTQQHYWGGLFLNDSGTFKNREADLEYPKIDGEYFDDSINGCVVGPELNFIDILNKEKIDIVDLLHMDIQGSELPLMKQLTELNLLRNFNNLVIATHSHSIHEEIKDILLKNNFTITEECKFGSVGGDGMFFATQES